MKVINIQKAKTHLSRFVDQAARGENIVIGKHGKPLAKLIAYTPEQAGTDIGRFEGKIIIAPDFDDENPLINTMFTQ
ncbi:type II toxin-antitoxin system prevent-host-death family antitoxin [Oscillatoria laete-virens NRMC-F 0139]|nr:type II toxin-antitoxin system prevent-host-death family antitoxin [Oscillatoria laete-virens]MDL5054006.1 type II toxin-antitoxin system prevent-host-death family antitoxin [Oscillatoria laete-virens NRMC-F 0139]